MFRASIEYFVRLLIFLYIFYFLSFLQNASIIQYVDYSEESLDITMICSQDAIPIRIIRDTHFTLWLFAAFTVLLMLAYSSIHSGDQIVFVNQEQPAFYNAPGSLIKTSTCRIPDFDPYDPQVSSKFLTKAVVRCPKLPPLFIRPQVKGIYSVPYLDETILWRHYKLKKQNLRCTYQIAIRDERSTPDFGFQLVNETTLKFGEFIDAEYVWIECFRYSLKTRFYSQPLLLARAKGDSVFDESSASNRPYNVIVLGYDSVSRLNFHRALTQTKKFLDNRPNTVIELLGYNKVGLNSSPNQIPLLTGHRFRPHGLYEEVKKGYLDNMTRYIWDDFNDAGYSTMFFEEQWSYGIFVWPELKGFRTQPVDYWPRPIMQMIDGSSLKMNLGNGICIGPKPAASIYLDYVLDLLRTSRKPLWLYPWLSELSHNDLTGASRADKPFIEFFTAMEREGFLNNSIIIFISDHGFRFGNFRNTPLGRYEDQLPFGYLMLPPSFIEERPEAVENLRVNSHRLVTVYDMHATMLELATLDQGPVTRTERGYSLFSEIVPYNRTCAEAGIDFEYCSCYDVANQRVDPALSVQLGQTIVDEINNELKRNKAIKCVEWKLGTVNQALPLTEGSRILNIYRVSINTIPPGRFEATIAIEPKAKNGLKLISGVDRTDWFSEHARCAMPSSYERFCYCL